MGKMEDIQKSIEQLSPEEFARLRDWLEDLDGRLLDEKIARDADSGKLDTVLAEVKANIAAGRGEEF
jgi:hypothetical protein